MSFEESLVSAKKYYTFSSWREAYKAGLDQYTQENCDRAQAIADQLISGLADLGPDASDVAKIELFRVAVEAYNSLNEEIDHP
jgi:hypothetical protein